MRSQISVTCALALASAVVAAPGQLTARQQPFQSTPVADLAEPWSMAFLPDDRILVTEKGGVLRLIDPKTGAKGTVSGTPTVRYGGQGGLGDVALHPQFTENKRIYISFAEAGDSQEQIGAALVRATLSLDDNGGGSLSDVETIWRQSTKYATEGHFSHRLLFGGDNNTLFVSSGDRQQFDPAQDMAGNLGKILRLNDDGTPAPGNPFASEGGVTSQIWALGVRNPLGIDWDEEGRLWEIEMGPKGGDEINLIQEGANYGWPIVSDGNHYDDEPIPDHSTRPEFNPPKVSWTPVISPSSVIIYKGDLFSGWRGNAIISGLGSLGLVRVEISGDSAREAERLSLGTRIRCVRQSADGALWVLEDGTTGRLLKLTPS